MESLLGGLPSLLFWERGAGGAMNGNEENRVLQYCPQISRDRLKGGEGVMEDSGSEVSHIEFGGHQTAAVLSCAWANFIPHLTEEWFKIQRVLIIYLPKAHTVPRWHNGFYPRFLEFAVKMQMRSLAQSSQRNWGGRYTYTAKTT